MCGIVGCTEALAELASARDSMHHRGPDDAGLSWGSDANQSVGLAQRRLAIIDCSPAGHQPMVDSQQEMTIVFNGEIYNFLELRHELEGLGHHFRSRSDTEVLLAAYRQWGENCPRRLNGMFAFCIYDNSQRKLFLARDRAGEKPLFYWYRNGRLVFASEIKALLQLPGVSRQLNHDALEYYLAYGYVPGDMCLLQGIQKLPQGHAMTYDMARDRLHVWRYWQLPEHRPDENASDEQLVDELETHLEDSVRRQLVADVPVGILLSGGLDSSLVTAMAARVSTKPIKTFTVSFPGHGHYDEAPYARQIASHFGTEHIELAGEMQSIDLLPLLAQQFDEPLADDSIVPTYLVSKLIREHATVALGGDGGDELFGGYYQHSWIQQLEQRRRYFPQFLAGLLRGPATHLIPTGMRGRNYLLALLQDVPGGIAQFNLYFDAAERRDLLTTSKAQSGRSSTPEQFKAELATRFDSTLLKSTGVDFMTYLVDDILVKVDRSSMLASLEVRAPFLDYRLIEFAFGRVPDRLKATAHERKILPRKLGQRLLPSNMDLRRKQGFSLPLDSWFQNGWGTFVGDILRDADSRLFSQKFIQGLIEGQRKGRNNTRRLFSLTMFELWRRHYKIEL
jgi:asparagine synthase (glutamine-hydrolysing)